jgi:hypothetical protein
MSPLTQVYKQYIVIYTISVFLCQGKHGILSWYASNIDFSGKNILNKRFGTFNDCRKKRNSGYSAVHLMVFWFFSGNYREYIQSS